MIRLTITGPPMTKKTSSQVVHSGPKCGGCGRGTGRPFVLPSAQNKKWTASEVRQLREQLQRAPSDLPVVMLPYFTARVSCRATVYRERAVGDLINYEQAIADALEEAGVVANDRLIVSWDGSRLDKDAENPRVEIELAPFD